MQGADANIRAVITADDRASSTIANFGKRADKTFTNTIRNAKRLAILGFGAVVAGAVSSVKAFNESEAATAQLNAVLKSTKGAAGVSSKAALNLAKSLQKVTTFSDEEILSAENLILTFTKINKKIFPDTVKIVADMSTALGQDLKSSSIQVGKALQDPILGVTALKRVGVNFSEAQRDVIKNLVETGQAAKAQKIILKELQTEFGGSSAAAAKTFGGAMKILGNNINDVQETIGQLIVEKLGPLVTKFNEWVVKHEPQIRQAFQNLIDKLIALGTFIVDNWSHIKKLIAVYIALKTALFLTGALGAFTRVMTGVRAAAALTAGPKGIGLINARVGIMGRLLASPHIITISIAAALLTLSILMKKVMEADKILGNFVSKYQDQEKTARQKVLDAKSKKGRQKAAVELYKLQNNPGGQTARSLIKSAKRRAMGGNVVKDSPYMVGERGPEMIVPSKSGRVVPNNRLSGSSGVVFNVNIGMFAGTAMERRKIADTLFNDMRTLALSKGVDLPAMLGRT